MYSDGRVGFCCADDNGFFDLGNILDDDPLEVYNCEQFWKYRRYMHDGRIGELEYCKDCTIPHSREKKMDPKIGSALHIRMQKNHSKTVKDNKQWSQKGIEVPRWNFRPPT